MELKDFKKGKYYFNISNKRKLMCIDIKNATIIMYCYWNCNIDYYQDNLERFKEFDLEIAKKNKIKEMEEKLEKLEEEIECYKSGECVV